MRIAADFVTSDIRQVDRVMPVNTAMAYNGRFALPIPEGAQVQLDENSYILPQDGGDVAALAALSLLAQYPMYSNVAYNFFLEATDVADIDLAATGPSGEITRVQLGRAVGPASTGIYPNMVAILPQNDTVAPARPGCLVTDTIDIGPATGGMGADEIMVWWYLYRYTNTDDVRSDYGATAGTNQPGTKNIVEINQEPAALSVYLSNDDGVTWFACDRLTPTDLLVFDTSVRIAFVNTGINKLYLAGYAILF